MENNISNNFVSIIKGVAISIISTIILLFIFSILLTYTNISESLITTVIIVVTAISIFIGSTIANIKMKKNGLLNGALIGGIYLMSMYILSSIISKNFSITIQSFIMIIAGMICGMFGGVMGINKR